MWDSQAVVWGFYGPYAPAFSADLYGTEPQKMLDWLPRYYEPSTHVREMMQSEGYEFDSIWNLVRSEFPLLSQINDSPRWALAMWESVLSLAPRPGWADADRRHAIACFLAVTVTRAEVLTFLSCQARCDPEDITLSFPSAYTAAFTTTGLEPEDVVQIKDAALRAMPAHMSVVVDGVTLR